MLTGELRAEKDRISALFRIIDGVVNDVDIRLGSVFANHMAIRSAGFVEKSVQVTLEEFCKARTEPRISNYVRKMAERENSFNCEKIKALLDRFDKTWWPRITDRVPPETLEAVDSLKTIRDQLAHGNHNGTGLNVIKQYFLAVVTLSEEMSETILS